MCSSDLGYIGQLDFRFTGSNGSHAPLRNILLAGTRRLHHLVSSTRITTQVASAESYRQIVNDLGLAE